MGLRTLYSKDGYRWKDLDTNMLKPLVGDKIMRDPSMAQSPDGTFHLVWTCAWKGNSGIGYASSKDLLHWSDQQVIDVMKKEAATVNVWAPEIFYDDEKAEFIIFWASTIPFRFPKGIEDEENNHRMYYTTTKDFKTFSETKLFLDPGFSVIDCVIVKRGKNDYVLVLKDNTRQQRNIKIAFAKNPLGPYNKPSEAFTENFTEGPSVLKTGDHWLVYFDAYRLKKYGAMETRDFVHFSDASSRISIPEGHKHGTILKIKKRYLSPILRRQR